MPRLAATRLGVILMTRKELNLAIFERKTDKVLWQPRLEEWIFRNKMNNALPAPYKDMEHLEIYDHLRCSVRYAASTGLEGYNDPDDIQSTHERRGDHLYVTTTTPSGSITTVYHEIWEGDKIVNSRIDDFPVKTPADLRVLIDIVERTQFRANQETFRVAAERMGDRGEPAMIIASSGFTDLIKHHSGLVDAFYLLYDYQDEVEAYLEACDRRDDRMLDAAFQLPCRIFNFGDHATDEFSPPPIMKKYLLPRWQRLSARMHEADRFIHSHWDGHSKTILPYLKDSGLDSVEALTPQPMGNISLEEIKAAVGDKMVVLDLLPAIHFLPSYSTEEVLEFAKKVIDMFAPRLILGVSDEISSVGQIEKIEAVSNLVDQICGLAD